MSEIEPSSASEEVTGRESAKQFIWKIVPTLILLFPLTTLLEAWALTRLWLWFVVPQFGVGPLSLPIAAGLDILAGFLAHKQYPMPTHKEGKEGKQTKLSYAETMGRTLVPNFSFSLLRIVFMVLAGAIVHQFVKH